MSGLVFLSLLISALTSAAAAPAARAPEKGGTLVLAASADARTLVPILASDSASAAVCGLIFNGLVKYDADLELTGDLAESWDVSADGLTITFHLRRNVLWQDGRPFSARDVLFTYNKLIDPTVRTAYAGDFLLVKDIRAPDPTTVVVTYAEPFAPALASWGMGILPEHILNNVDLNTAAAIQPVGTGPWRLKTWRRNERMELRSFPGYFDTQAMITRLFERIIPDETTAFLALETQDVDAAGLTPLQYARQTDTALFKERYRKFRTPGFGYTYLGYNLNDPRFKDARVRRALALAVDKNEIIRIVLLGMGRVVTGPFVPQSWAYDERIADAGYDPGAARRLLAEAGWRDTDGDGRLDKDGRPFSFTILTNQGNDQREKTAQLLQGYFKDIGVEAKIKVVEWSALLSEFIDKRRFEAVLLGWSLGRDPDVYDIWHSSKTKEGEFNFISYGNAEVDDLLVRGRRTFDQKERQRIYRRIHAILNEEQPVLFLYSADTLEAVSRRVEGIVPAAAGIGYNMPKWWIPAEERRYRNLMEQ
ncbi:MAG: peptide-binding protein [Deltaproteobacteria bacterium]